MAEYLQGTVERLGQAWAKEQGYHSVFVREAIAHREGIADRLSSRLRTARRERLAEERRKKEEQAEAARSSGTHTGNALVLMDVINSEEDLNADYLYGEEPGTNAARRAKREAAWAAADFAAKEEERKRDEAEAADPALKEARLAEEAKLKAEQDKRWAEEDRRQAKLAARRKGGYRARRETPREQRQGLNSYYDGYDKGAEIGLDKQIDKTSNKAIA